jgi:RNA polymerase sigma-70 factor (ECF subfamily)
MTSDVPVSETDMTRDLLSKAQAGDPRAFNELFARHRLALYRLIARRLRGSLRGRIDPSDVVQEVHIEATERLSGYLTRRPMAFRKWLMRTAVERVWKLRRHASAARRDVRRERPLADDRVANPGLLHAIVDPRATPSQQLAARDRANRLHAALGRLPGPDRAILEMRAFQGLPYDEVAARLSIDPAAARKRYGRALLRLRASLLAEGFGESHL